MTIRDLRLEVLKMVWPAEGNPDPVHYITKAEMLLKWINAVGDNGSATPAPQPDPSELKSGARRKTPGIA